MTIFLRLELYKILLYTARIACENTYDMRGIFSICCVCLVMFCKDQSFTGSELIRIPITAQI